MSFTLEDKENLKKAVLDGLNHLKPIGSISSIDEYVDSLATVLNNLKNSSIESVFEDFFRQFSDKDVNEAVKAALATFKLYFGNKYQKNELKVATNGAIDEYWIPEYSVEPYNPPKEKRKKALNKKAFFFFICAVLLIIGGVLIGHYINYPTKNATTAVATTETTTKPQSTIDGAVKAMSEAEWGRGQFRLETEDGFDPTVDSSTGGDGSFNTAGYKTSADYISWLCSESNEANTSLNYITAETGDSIDDVKNVENWIAVQALVVFNYHGNLSYDDGVIANQGRRSGHVNDIFFVYVSPTQVDDGSATNVVAVRGACSNPQMGIPNLQKSSNPADYKQPGDDNKTDSGTGTRPKSTVTEPVESTPTTVVSNDGSSSVTDPIGSETITVAPGASSPTQDTSDDTDVSGDDTLNEGDSGSPF